MLAGGVRKKERKHGGRRAKCPKEETCRRCKFCCRLPQPHPREAQPEVHGTPEAEPLQDCVFRELVLAAMSGWVHQLVADPLEDVDRQGCYHAIVLGAVIRDAPGGEVLLHEVEPPVRGARIEL